MRKMIMAAALALSASAWAQTTLSTDRFTVTTDGQNAYALAGGTVKVDGMPYLLSLSSPGQSGGASSALFSLDFTAQPGWVLLGEQVSYELTMNVDTYDLPSDLLLKAFGTFTVDVNGVYSFGRTSDGGTYAISERYFLTDPSLLARVSAETQEGHACPIGHEADSCGFGGFWRDLDAVVALTSFTVTPLLSAIPEPDVLSCWLAAALLLGGTTLARRQGRFGPR